MYPLLSVQCCIWSAASQRILNEDGKIDWGLAIGEGMFSAVMAGIVWEYGGGGGKTEVWKDDKKVTINTARYKMQLGERRPLSSLNKRQRELLKMLEKPGDMVKIRKRSVSMNDLLQLTNVTGDEFNMFTLGSKRLIIRGLGNRIDVSNQVLDEIITFYRFSGHTHPPGYSIEPGPKDGQFLKKVVQKRSAIWGTGVDKYGQTREGGLPFGADKISTDEIRSEIEREKMRRFYEK